MDFSIILKSSLLLSTSLMVGAIWIVQLVHYPAFLFVDPKKFKDFEAFHAKTISYIVMPLMLTELFCSVSLFLTSNSQWLPLSINLFLLLMIWIITFFISVPCHTQLTQGYNETIIKRLVNTNWLRTLLWSSRWLLLIYYFAPYE